MPGPDAVVRVTSDGPARRDHEHARVVAAGCDAVKQDRVGLRVRCSRVASRLIHQRNWRERDVRPGPLEEVDRATEMISEPHVVVIEEEEVAPARPRSAGIVWRRLIPRVLREVAPADPRVVEGPDEI